MEIGRILVVDDDNRTCELLRAFLDPTVYSISVAHSGSEAAAWAASEHFDLVITDMSMPDGDGIWLIRQLRRDHPEVRIVAMTGPWVIGAEAYLNRAKGLSVDGILMKPFLSEHVQHLIHTIERRVNA